MYVPHLRSIVRVLFVLACVVWGASPILADTVTLRRGDVLTGTIVEDTDAAVVLEHPDLGRMTIPRSSIAPVVEEPDAETVRSSGVFGTSFLEGWRHKVEAGVNGSEGNSQDLSFRVAVKSTYADERDRWNVEHTYYRASSGGTTSANEVAAVVTKDWLLPERPWFVFARSRYDYDEFKDWTHRISAYGGIGRQLIENERWDVVGRVGAGATREFGSMDMSIQPNGLLGLEATYTISDRSAIVASSTAYPTLDELDIRVISAAAWNAVVSEDGRISIKLGVEHEYESDVDPGIDPHDIKYYGGIAVDL